MRVGIVAPYDLAVPGGVQNQVVGLACALRALGDDVLLLAPGASEAWTIGAELRDVTIVAGTGAVAVLAGTGLAVPLPANGSRAPVTISPLATQRTRAALSLFRPDVIHVHEPFVPGPSSAAACAEVAPVVATFHRSGVTAAYRLLGPLLRRVVRHLDRSFAVSEAACDTLRAVLGTAELDVELRANAVDLQRLSSAAAVPLAVAVERA